MRLAGKLFGGCFGGVARRFEATGARGKAVWGVSRVVVHHGSLWEMVWHMSWGMSQATKRSFRQSGLGCITGILQAAGVCR